MAYQKQTWTDELLDPKTMLNGKPAYRITDAGGKVISEKANIDLATTVSMAGTKVDAARLTHIENGIADGHALATAADTKAVTAVNAAADAQAAVDELRSGGIGSIDMQAIVASVVNTLHPIGSVIISADSTNPGTRFPGTTWEAFAQGRVIIGIGNNGTNSYSSITAAGSDNRKLAANNMPSHTHTFDHNHYVESHTHTQAAHAHNLIYSSSGKTLSLNGGGSNYKLTWDTTGATTADILTTSATPAINASGQLYTDSQTSNVTSATGGTVAVDMRQSYQTAYYWRRTA